MNLSVNQGYTFDIIGYDQWPSVTIKYAFKNIGPVPQLQLSYKFDTGAYLPQTNSADTDLEALQQKVTTDLTTYKNIYTQLNWLYATDEKPDEQQRVIKHAATTNLTPAEPISFAEEDHAGLEKFVKAITTWLQRLLDAPTKAKHTARTPIMKPVLLPITGALEANDIFEIGVNLLINRIDADTSLQISQATKAVLPDIKTGVSLKAGQKAFAQNFETAFKTTGSRLKLAVGRGNYNNAIQLWAVRLADGDIGNGISYSISPDAATSFAPVPLSQNLVSGNVNVSPYISCQGINWGAPTTGLQYQNIDLDAWMAIFLQSIDQVLSKPAVDAVLTCATLNTLQQPNGINPLQEIMITKTGIAAQLIKLLVPVVTQQTGNLNNAINYLTEQLNQNLANFYSGTAIVQFNAPVTANTEANLVGLYGKMVPVAANADIAFADALIPNAANSTISFNVISNNVQQQSYLPISVTYQPTGLDYEFAKGIIIPLSFSIPPAADLTVLTANVPMVLRAYPQPLTITQQVTQGTYADDAITLQNIRLYDYVYQYQQPLVAQDIVETKLIINGADLVTAPGYSDTNNLFKSLAQFISAYPQISADLKASLPLINKNTTINDAAYKLALPALISLAELSGKVQSAFNTSNATLKAGQLSPNPETSYSFTLQQMPVKPVADTRLLIQVTANKGQPTPLSLPLPLIDGYDAILFDTVDDNISISKSYTYVSAENGALLFNTPPTVLSPAIKFSSLDVLNAEQINLLINETRNKNLLPNPAGGYYTTDERFIYTIPQNNNLPAVSPLLSWNGVEFDIQSLNLLPAKADLQICLQLLFSKIFSNINAVNYNTKVIVTYEYKIDGGEFSPSASMPVLLLPKTLVGTVNCGDVAQNLYSGIQNWLATVSPEKIEPRVYFEIEIFTSLSDSDKPILSIYRLYFNLSDVN